MKKTVLLIVVMLSLLVSNSLSAFVLTPTKRTAIVEVAKEFVGVPYRFGGNTLKGIDCSAFVKKVYAIFGISIPRTTREQIKTGRKVGKHELEEGDLVFFRTSKGRHVGIYIGDNQFIHASAIARRVKIDNLGDKYFGKHFIMAIRVNFTGE